MKLVHEDEHGAYLGVDEEFLKEFVLKENNPNFEVYDSQDGHRRFMAVKSSRLPDDQDLAEGRYGIDFNRAKPKLREALRYGAELPHGFNWLGNIAFAAKTKEDYNKKSSNWDNFYSYIWDLTPQTVWVAPHSGSVNRAPDDIIRYPKLMIDPYTAGVAALCAFNDRSRASKRLMIAIHGTGHLGAVLNLGDFGVVDENKMNTIAKHIERKYHQKVQILADEYKQDFFIKTMKILEHIRDKRGTLNPEELRLTSMDDSFTVSLYIKGLEYYGQEIRECTLTKFRKTIQSLGNIEIPVILNNYFYTARKTGQRLKLSEKIECGLMHSALNIECAKLYLTREPELLANMILDVKNELYD